MISDFGLKVNTDNTRRGGNFASIQTFLIISTSFLYLVAAGLFSRSIWLFEANKVSCWERRLMLDTDVDIVEWNHRR